MLQFSELNFTTELPRKASEEINNLLKNLLHD